jgi:hypothetical protein
MWSMMAISFNGEKLSLLEIMSGNNGDIPSRKIISTFRRDLTVAEARHTAGRGQPAISLWSWRSPSITP